uniref:Uncharacterized protein n=1 Tax=Meloidogyne javanica TaxID=6303 RepID=A0A915MGL4_MELJA
MIENDEPSLQQQFVYCENIVEDLLHDRLGDSKSQQRNDKLKNCIERLQLVSRTVESLSLFSTNDQVEELPTTSLRYLLVPAYFAYVLQEINVEIGKRPVYLKSAKASYREFLQNLLTYGLINFKLPWINGDEDTTKIELKKESFEDLSAKRQQKISRLRQMEQLENTLEKLRIEERRDDDDAAKREVIFVLLRLWSIRAVKELDTIDDELRLLEQASSCVAEESTSNMSHVEQTAKFTPFILTRTEQQKKVFGLGYPSIPTVSVDECFDYMMSNLIDQKSESEESGEDSVDHILNLRPKIVAKRRLKGINSNSPTKTDSFDNVIEDKKPENAGKLWEETTVMRSLEEKLVSGNGSSIAQLRDRGVETYALDLGKKNFNIKNRKRRCTDDIYDTLMKQEGEDLNDKEAKFEVFI